MVMALIDKFKKSTGVVKRASGLAGIRAMAKNPVQPEVAAPEASRQPVEQAYTPDQWAGSELIKDYEKLKLKGYYATDHEREKGVVTVGYGQTGVVGFGEEIDEDKANELFVSHLQQIDAKLDDLLKVRVTEKQRGALRSLIYNVGIGSFANSKALKALNSGDIAEFKEQAFSAEKGWVKQGGKVLNGLVRRRKDELALWEAGEKAEEDSKLQRVAETDNSQTIIIDDEEVS